MEEVHQCAFGVCAAFQRKHDGGTGGGNLFNRIVNGGSGLNRVNLRASTSVSSQSLGVELIPARRWCAHGGRRPWLDAGVCGRTAWLHAPTRYITKTNSALPARVWCWGRLRCTRRRRAAPVLAYCYQGQSVTILGETNSQWYYVLADGRVGYIPANLSSGRRRFHAGGQLRHGDH